MPGPADLVSNALAQRQLSTRDRRLHGQLDSIGGATGEQEALAQDLTPANIQALGQAIDAAKDPRQKMMLMEELARLKDLAQNLMGPVNPPPMLPGSIPQGVQRAPYDPAEQAPGIYGGQRMSMPPTPGRM